MNDKNIIVTNYAIAGVTMMNNLSATLGALGDDAEINAGIIKTAYIQVDALNAQIVILKNALDNYGG